MQRPGMRSRPLAPAAVIPCREPTAAGRLGYEGGPWACSSTSGRAHAPLQEKPPEDEVLELGRIHLAVQDVSSGIEMAFELGKRQFRHNSTQTKADMRGDNPKIPPVSSHEG